MIEMIRMRQSMRRLSERDRAIHYSTICLDPESYVMNPPVSSIHRPSKPRIPNEQYGSKELLWYRSFPRLQTWDSWRMISIISKTPVRSFISKGWITLCRSQSTHLPWRRNGDPGGRLADSRMPPQALEQTLHTLIELDHCGTRSSQPFLPRDQQEVFSEEKKELFHRMQV